MKSAVGESPVVFDVAGATVVRLRDPNCPDGGFLCTHAVELPAGKYACEIDPESLASGAGVTAAALVQDGTSWNYLTHMTFPAGQPRKRPRPVSFSFQLDQTRAVAFHVHADARFAKMSLRGLRVRALTALSPLSLPVLSPPQYKSWPIDRLRFVMIGTTSICNASCVHCPTNKELTRHLPKKVMAWELFEKLIREIRDLPLAIDGHVGFGVYAEPLLDPLVLQRAALVKDYLPNARLVITSNGGPLTEELAVALGKYVDIFCIHIEALSPALYRELMFPLHAEQVFPKVEQLIRVCGKPVWIVCPPHKKN